MAIDQRIIIFAKRPQPGKAKTRLSKEASRHLGLIPLETGATIYQAFLDDYGRRFSSPDAPPGAVFCLPDRPESHDPEPLASTELPRIIEAKRDGAGATSIGEAMSFTIDEQLAQGAKKVVILGSDLPHMPFDVIEEALRVLDEHPLVLGNDGGGCYLVAAKEHAEVLEDPGITWSEGRDFEQIVSKQKGLNKSVGVLSATLDDIDRAADLDALIDRLQNEPALRLEIPATVQVLKELGATFEDKQEGRRPMKIVVNGESLETPHTKLADLMSALNIKRQGCAVEINEEIVPRARIDDQEISEGDVIEIVRLVGGG